MSSSTIDHSATEAPKPRAKPNFGNIFAAIGAICIALRNGCVAVSRGIVAQSDEHAAQRTSNAATYFYVAGWMTFISVIVYGLIPSMGLWVMGSIALAQLAIATLLAWVLGRQREPRMSPTNTGDPAQN